MSDDRLPMPGHACPVCGARVIKARLSEGVTRVFDAEKTPGGEWALWFSSLLGSAGGWRARAATPETWSGDTAYQLHACAGRAGQQLELGGAA